MPDDLPPLARSTVDPDLPARDDSPLAARLVAAVAVGGVLGALARYALGEALPTATGVFPATTLLINVTGAFLLAVLVGTLTRAPRRGALWRPLLGTGVLGGYTTFSTFAVDTARLTSLGHLGVAVGYVAATLAGGALATAVGMVASAELP